MRSVKALIAMLLISVLCLGLFAGCGSDEADLRGSWYTRVPNSSETIENLLAGHDLYEEEIALVDTSSYYDLLTIRLNSDGSYRFFYDRVQNQELANTFVDNMMVRFHENLDTMSALYEYDMTGMSLSEFKEFYATEVYGMSGYSEFQQTLSDDLCMAEELEAGTYRISGSKIYFKVTGETEEEYVAYSLSGDTLTLNFTDGTRKCTKTP